jgi:hypothetical protein
MRTHRLVPVVITTAVSIMATALLMSVLLPSLSPATEATAMSLSLASGARGPIPGLGPCDYVVYYGPLDEETLEDLKAFDLVILHPEGGITQTQVAELQADGVIVLGYVSIGEEEPPPGGTPIAGDGSGPVYYEPGENCCGTNNRHCESQGVACYYLDEITNTTGDLGHDGLPDVNVSWGSYYVDPAASLWREGVKLCGTSTYTECSFYGTEYVINTLGCDGLFLDTVDTASPWHPYSYTLDAMADFICTISGWYTDSYVVLNRGIFFAAPEYGADVVRPCINGIVFEGYYSEWDWEEDEGRLSPWFVDNRDNWAPKLNVQAIMTDGYTIFALDYFTPTQQISITHQISETVTRWGWLDYVSTPMLDTVRWEVWRHCCQVWLPLIMRDGQ